MNQTDILLNTILEKNDIPNAISTTTRATPSLPSLPTTTTTTTTTTKVNTNTIPILYAPEFNWSYAPSIIDPAVGGGLSLVSSTSTSFSSSTTTILDESSCTNNTAASIHQLSSSSSEIVVSNRATRKRAAVEAFYTIVDQILQCNNSTKGSHLTTTIADLGCGAGNLALPLAWWLNHYNDVKSKNNTNAMGTSRNASVTTASSLHRYRVLGIDLNTISLQRLRNRSNQLQLLYDDVPLIETIEMDLLNLIDNTTTTSSSTNNDNIDLFRNCAAVVSLHACGAASDLAIAAAVQHNLPFAISPCCIGKTLTSRSSSTSSNASNNITTSGRKVPLTLPPTQRGSAPSGTISYPRSIWLQSRVTSANYSLIAAAADYGVRQSVSHEFLNKDNNNYNSNNKINTDHDEIQRFQRSRRAKRIIEIDRLQWAYEHGYYVRMMELPRIGPLYSKREVLLGAKQDSLEAQRIAQLPVLSFLT